MSPKYYQIGKKQPKPPRQKATALGYEPQVDKAPKVLASGQGLIAEKIIAIAKQNNIPIREDPALATALSVLDIGQEIPPELYAVIAEVLAYVYRIQNKKISDNIAAINLDRKS